MKIVPEQTTTNLIHTDSTGFKLDLGAVCFFVLGVFLAALFSHFMGWF